MMRDRGNDSKKTKIQERRENLKMQLTWRKGKPRENQGQQEEFNTLRKLEMKKLERI